MWRDPIADDRLGKGGGEGGADRGDWDTLYIHLGILQLPHYSSLAFGMALDGLLSSTLVSGTLMIWRLYDWAPFLPTGCFPGDSEASFCSSLAGGKCRPLLVLSPTNKMLVWSAPLPWQMPEGKSSLLTKRFPSTFSTFICWNWQRDHQPFSLGIRMLSVLLPSIPPLSASRGT